MKPVRIVAAVPAIAKRTRLAKIARILEEHRIPVEFWGWERQPGEALPSAVPTRILVKGGGYSSRSLAAYYPRWMLRVFCATLLGESAVVHALGLESALPACLAQRLRRDLRIIFDDADRRSQSHDLPRLPRYVLERLERWASRRAHLHIVPGVERYPDGIPARRVAVLKNTPSSEALAASSAIDPFRPADADFVIYANGWIGDQRGAHQLDALACGLADLPRVRIVVAGRLTGAAAARLVTRPNVHCLGELANAQALAQYRASDVVLTLYDPSIRINRLAEPNKWGDCVALGTPFIVNSEVVTARQYLEAGAAFAYPYADTAALVALCKELAGAPDRLARAREALHRLDQEQLSFEQQYEQLVLPVVTHS